MTRRSSGEERNAAIRPGIASAALGLNGAPTAATIVCRAGLVERAFSKNRLWGGRDKDSTTISLVKTGNRKNHFVSYTAASG